MDDRSSRLEPTPTAEALRAAFDAERAQTVGLEEEVMVLDPHSLDLAPLAPVLLERLDGDPRFKAELPAAQLEIVTGPAQDIGAAAAQLDEARRHAAEVAEGVARLAAAGAHPFASPEGVLSRDERYAHTRETYGFVARRQLVYGLHLHVALGGADRALAVYNALRSYLPELAALAACAPFHAGDDSGLASVRPHISGMLPRQGVPPVLESWDAYARALEWVESAGFAGSARQWWWELRPHPFLGTLELRVPDAQATTRDAAAVAAVAHCLIVSLAERRDAGEALPAAPAWRIAENRWSACRYGLAGTMADLETGETQATSARVERLLDELAPTAPALGCADELAHASALLAEPSPERHRRLARDGGPPAIAQWLAERFCA